MEPSMILVNMLDTGKRTILSLMSCLIKLYISVGMCFVTEWLRLFLHVSLGTFGSSSGCPFSHVSDHYPPTEFQLPEPPPPPYPAEPVWNPQMQAIRKRKNAGYQ